MHGLPLRKRRAVDAFARLILAEVDAALGGRFAVPVGEAVAAETGQDHQVDVLHIRALFVEVSQQAAEGRCFESVVESVTSFLRDAKPILPRASQRR